MKLVNRFFVLMISGMMSSSYATGEGFYLGVQGGRANMHNQANLTVTGGTTSSGAQASSGTATPSSSKGFGFRIYGGYQYNIYIGGEMGFAFYPSTKYTITYPSSPPPNTVSNGQPSIHVQALDLVLKGMYPVYYGFGVFGKGGVAFARVVNSGSLSPPGSNSTSSIKTRPTFSLGVSYDFTPKWVFELTWSRITKAGGTTFQNADLYSLGVTYHFVDEYCGQFLC